MTLIDPSVTVTEFLDRHPAAMRVFIGRRMSCVGCVIAPYHTIDEACRAYELPCDDFLRELAEAVDR